MLFIIGVFCATYVITGLVMTILEVNGNAEIKEGGFFSIIGVFVLLCVTGGYGTIIPVEVPVKKKEVITNIYERNLKMGGL